MKEKKMKNESKKRTIDILKRKLLRLGIYSAPIILSVSIPDIKIQAQTAGGSGGRGDLPAPPIRKKSIIEQEKNENEKKNNKKKDKD
jgi:hypothetical protein